MKKLLKFLVVVNLTTTVGISTVACGTSQSDNKAKMSTEILEQLGLIDTEGKGLKEVILKWNENEPYFDVDQESIKLTDLLVDQDQELARAKDEVSFDFLRALKIELKEGTTFEDGLFEVEEVSSIKAKITNTEAVTTSKFVDNDNETLVIESGTYKLQFFNADGSKALSENRQIKVKADTNALFGVFGLSGDPISLGYEEFVYSGSVLENFKIGANSSDIKKIADEKTVIRVMTENETDKAIKFKEFQKLTGWEMAFQIDSAVISQGTIKEYDELVLDVILTKNDHTFLLFKRISLVAMI